MCVPSNVQPGPKRGVPDQAVGPRSGPAAAYAPVSDGEAGLSVPDAPTSLLPAQASETARARVGLPGEARTGPTLPAQASDVARRAVAGEMKGKGNNNAGGNGNSEGRGEGKGGGKGKSKPAGDSYFVRRGRPMGAGFTGGSRRRRSSGIGTFSGLLIPPG